MKMMMTARATAMDIRRNATAIYRMGKGQVSSVTYIKQGVQHGSYCKPGNFCSDKSLLSFKIEFSIREEMLEDNGLDMIF